MNTTVIIIMIISATVIALVAIICDHCFERKSTDSYDCYMSKKIIKVHRNYIAGFLGFAVIMLITAEYGGPENAIFGYLSFGSTITSLVLSILAIFVTVQSSSDMYKQFTKIENATNTIKNASIQIDGTLAALKETESNLQNTSNGISSQLDNIVEKIKSQMKAIRKILIIAMMLISCLFCQAQEEAVSMLEGNPIWVFYKYVGFINAPYEKNAYFVYSVNGDTIVNNKRYVKLYRDTYMYKGITVNEFYGDEMIDDGLEALLREENDRIYAETSFFKKRNRKYCKAFELLDDELVLYDFNEMSQGKDISLWQDGVQTSKRFVGVDMVSLEDGNSRSLYKYYNYDKDMYRFMPANLEVIDHIGCRNMPLGFLNYFLEPEPSARPNNTEWLGIKLNLFIQNGKIVYKAPAEDYIELSWIDKLIATKIEDVYATQSQDESTQKKGMGSIYSVFGQRISVNSVFSVPSVLPKGVYIVDGKKVWVK